MKLLALLFVGLLACASPSQNRVTFIDQGTALLTQGPIVGPEGQKDAYVARWTDAQGAQHEVVTLRTGAASLQQHLASVRTYMQAFPPVPPKKNTPGP